MPSNARLLPYRSNIPYLSDWCLNPADPGFAGRAKEKNGGFIVAGSNYGQGSSREHAALAPLYLGIRAVIVKSIARIHRDNLINSGILPLVFESAADYDRIDSGDALVISDPVGAVNNGIAEIENKTKNFTFTATMNIDDRQKEILKAGGTINYMKG